MLRVSSRAAVTKDQKFSGRVKRLSNHRGGAFDILAVLFEEATLYLETVSDDGRDSFCHDELSGRFSRSLRSFSRPLAFLFSRRCCRLIKLTGSSSNSVSSLPE